MGDETKVNEVLRGNTNPLAGVLKESTAEEIGPTSDAGQLPSVDEAIRQIEQRTGDAENVKQPALDKRADVREQKR